MGAKAYSEKETTEEWSSKIAFVLAAVGSAVGLGNLWRFPYVAGENGGGAFVVFYVICVVLIGLPVLVAELFIGRRGRLSSANSVLRIADAEGRSSLWAWQSYLGMIGSFIILTFYSVIAGWIMAFIAMIGSDLVQGIAIDGFGALMNGVFADQTRDDISAKLGALLSDPKRMIIYHGIFIALSVFIVAQGVTGGIEKAVVWLMPAFFVLLLALVVFALYSGDRARGLDFLFGFRLQDQISPNGDITTRGLFTGLKDGSIIGAALGQAFFSLSLGSAVLSTYGSHMSREQDLPESSGAIAIVDTSVGILAGIAIFPIVFQMGLAPAGGPTLMFSTLLLAFQGMPAGAVFGLFFFLLALVAAVTSAISLLETATAWFEEKRPGRQRGWVAVMLGLIIFVIGIANALSQLPTETDVFFNTWRPWGIIPLFQTGDGSAMELLSFLSALTDIILPVAGLITAIFAGWIVSTAVSREEIGFASEAWYQRWRFLIRWVCPVGIVTVIVYGVVIAPFLLS
ncbi:MAG: sodium-dependent transporter [Pseudomonadota bacterium]